LCSRHVARSGAVAFDRVIDEMTKRAFECAFLTPLREQNKVAVLQCAECGTLIGVLDSPSAIQLENLQKQIAAIDAGLTISSLVSIEAVGIHGPPGQK
jgi:hypothetical protein